MSNEDNIVHLDDDDLETALLEAVWLMRSNKGTTAMVAVLTVEEAHQICNNIIEELGKAGYKIVRK